MPYDDEQSTLPVAASIAGHRRPSAVDLFCGVGGMGLGFEQAGFDVLVGVEWDPLLAAVHEFNHPSTRVVCCDVASLAGSAREKLSLAETELDVVFGGPPCQGFSSIGKRDAGDSRNDLVGIFIKVATELRPRYIVMENVEGILQPTMKQHIDQAKLSLTNAGYSYAEPKRMDACEFGVPQRRRRVFLIAWRADSQAFNWPVETHGKANSQLKPFVTVADAIGDLSLIAPTGRSAYARSLGARSTRSDAAPRKGVPKTLTGFELTSHNPQTVARFEQTVEGKEEPVSRYTRLSWSGVCHTMRAGTGPDRGSFMSARPIHPGEPRVITVREAARLHGYPDWFQFHRTKWHSFRGIGNSVPPPMARAIAGKICECLGITSSPATAVQLGSKNLLQLDPAAAALHFGGAQLAKRKRKASLHEA